MPRTSAGSAGTTVRICPAPLGSRRGGRPDPSLAQQGRRSPRHSVAAGDPPPTAPRPLTSPNSSPLSRRACPERSEGACPERSEEACPERSEGKGGQGGRTEAAEQCQPPEAERSAIYCSENAQTAPSAVTSTYCRPSTV